MPARASIAELTFIRCTLACITTMGRVADTRSSSRTDSRLAPK
jgi:hypothetical protein